MNILKDFKPDVNVSKAEYKRLLGYPYDYKLEGKALELAAWAGEWYGQNGKPSVFSVFFENLKIENEAVKIENIELTSKTLYKQFHKSAADKAVLLIATAGKECEEAALKLWEENKPDEYFFLEVYGSAVVEHMVSAAGHCVCDWAEKNNFAVLPHYSPGYSGWKIEDQNELWKLIKKYKPDSGWEIGLLDSGMLKPKKSMLALFGITEVREKATNILEFVPCRSCSFSNCQYRRLPYKSWRKQVEDVQDLRSREFDSFQKIKSEKQHFLDRNVKYSINTKALEKWSKERLTLKREANGSCEAVFNYEGTTCSNMGHKLAFNYYVKLSSPIEGYRIISLNCRPADDGYKYMCGYLKDEQILDKICNEKPLLGKQLEAVLKWVREFRPEACYCDSESRTYKWGMVYETLHFALVTQEKNVGSE